MTTLDNLTIGEAKQLASMFGAGAGAGTDKEVGDGRAVIVRSRDAGVLFGDYAGRQGTTIHLKNARQLWRWKAAKGGTLIDTATHGIDASGCKFSDATADATVFSACTLIDCSAAAAEEIRSAKSGDWS